MEYINSIAYVFNVDSGVVILLMVFAAVFLMALALPGVNKGKSRDTTGLARNLYGGKAHNYGNRRHKC